MIRTIPKRYLNRILYDNHSRSNSTTSSCDTYTNTSTFVDVNADTSVYTTTTFIVDECTEFISAEQELPIRKIKIYPLKTNKSDICKNIYRSKESKDIKISYNIKRLRCNRKGIGLRLRAKKGK